MSQYDFEIFYKPCKTIGNADALSRREYGPAPEADPNDEIFEEILTFSEGKEKEIQNSNEPQNENQESNVSINAPNATEVKCQNFKASSDSNEKISTILNLTQNETDSKTNNSNCFQAWKQYVATYLNTKQTYLCYSC